MMPSSNPLEAIEALVRKYKQLSSAQRKSYNEDNTRKDFIIPLFRALEWNTDTSTEVSAEEKVSRGWVDFAFRIRGVPRFFLETKRLREDLTKPEWIRQAIDYSWTKGVTWAVLSDFEGLRVFNAEWQEDNPLRAQFIDFSVDTYLTDFDRLWWLSKPEMAAGRLDREAEKIGKKVRKEPVTSHLFDDLRQWRAELFRYLKAYNKTYSISQIDEAVLRILNRLIFVRTAEDRLVEPPHLLPLVRELQSQGQIGRLPKELARLFREFDAAYDSDLFAEHFSEHMDCEPEPFQMLIEGLHEKRKAFIRYNFNAIDADVLGTAYEQYLGHTSADPDAAELLEKRRKRKAEGIFYTPTFVVRYIVQQTLGRHLKEHGYVPGTRPRVLDLACGSGSFLIEAFDFLDRFLAHSRGQSQGSSEDIFDHARRVEILGGSIFGVDRDPQAVAVAKLNLSLKVLYARDRLPMLDNIRCGDSLLWSNASDLKASFGEDWDAKRAFNWWEEFPRVFQDGGFDVIVGNPPYVRIQTLPEDEAEHFGRNYRTAKGSYDLYVLFVERALTLLAPSGLLGMILPNKFMQTAYGEALRDLLSREGAVWKIVDFEDAQVFPNATTYTCLLFLQKPGAPSVTYLQAGTALREQGAACLLDETALGRTELKPSLLTSAPWTLSSSHDSALVEKIRGAGPELGTLTSNVFQGLRTSANEVYVLDLVGDASGPTLRLKSKALGKTVILERSLLWPFLRGEDIKAYTITPPAKLILVPYEIQGGEASLVSPQVLEARCPLTWQYLLANRDALEARENGKMRHDHWYAYVYPKNLAQFATPKIITPDIAPRAAFALDVEGRFSFVSGYGITLKPEVRYDLRYILALVNSPPLDFFIKRIGTRLQHGYFRYFSQYIERLPIPQLDLDSAGDKALHDNVVSLVQQLIDLHTSHLLAEREFEDERHPLLNRIADVESALNDLLLPLFGLSRDDLPTEGP